MKFIPHDVLPELVIIEPKIFGDERGQFFECYRQDKFKEAGIDADFVQDNQSISAKGVLRGLHLQTQPAAQAKCVRVLEGEIFDVAVDVRPDSETFGKWASVRLSAENKRMLYIPTGFAHGFVVLSNTATLHYKCTALYSPEHERTLRYDDPEVDIEWPVTEGLIVSEKDQKGKGLGFFK